MPWAAPVVAAVALAARAHAPTVHDLVDSRLGHPDSLGLLGLRHPQRLEKTAEDVRPVADAEILHVRQLS